jgi:hypothetical protein
MCNEITAGSVAENVVTIIIEDSDDDAISKETPMKKKRTSQSENHQSRVREGCDEATVSNEQSTSLKNSSSKQHRGNQRHSYTTGESNRIGE